MFKQLALLSLLTVCSFGQVTNRDTYPIAAIPTLPAAGGKFEDFAFKTTTMRVTDALTDPTANRCYNDYSYYDVHNINNTRIQWQCEGVVTKNRFWADFNPHTFTLGTVHAFPLDPTGRGISGDGTAQWSVSDPKIMWVNGVVPPRLYTLDVTTNTFTLIKDFAGMPGMPAGTASLAIMSKDRQDRYFSFVVTNGVAFIGCFNWDRLNPNTAIYAFDQPYQQNTHNCSVDKTGRFFRLGIDVYDPNPPQNGNQVEVYDIVTTLIKKYNTLGPDWGPVGHYDNGKGYVVGMNGNFPDPSGAKVIHNFLELPSVYLPITGISDSDGHVTCRQDDETWCGSEVYRVTVWDGYPPFRQENFMYSTDGKGRVLRFSQHHSMPDVVGTDSYRAQPKFVISRDGQYGSWSSTMGDPTNRIDMYITRGNIRPSTQASSMGGGSMN